MYQLIIVVILIIFLVYIASRPCVENFQVRYKHPNKYSNKIRHICTPGETFRHLSFISYVLSINRLKHWLSHGTLENAVKYQDIKPNFLGFEIGTFINYRDILLAISDQLDFDGYEFRIGYRNNKFDSTFRVHFKGVPIGIIYLYEKTNGTLKRKDESFPFKFVEDLRIGTIKYNKFPIPQNTSEFLKHNYGK